MSWRRFTALLRGLSAESRWNLMLSDEDRTAPIVTTPEGASMAIKSFAKGAN
jgi:hypothetical protein